MKVIRVTKQVQKMLAKAAKAKEAYDVREWQRHLRRLAGG